MSWQAAIERTVTGMGYDLVDIERPVGGLLRVTIDRLPGQAYEPAGEFVTVEDCERLTRQLQNVLEVESCDYARLEVSSPGLDRPLKKLSDWQRFAGWQVQVTLRMPFQGRKNWRGLLAERDGGWRLELAPPQAAAKGRARPGGKAVPRAPNKAPGKVPANAAADATAGMQALDFVLDEVREARLVPVVDFKGRKPGDLAAPAPAQGEEEEVRR